MLPDKGLSVHKIAEKLTEIEKYYTILIKLKKLREIWKKGQLSNGF